jgi:PAS domain S-box-containing protein
MSKTAVMVVEDEALVALQIKEALEARGLDVPVVASSGEEALRKVTQAEPDVIVMDIRLKGKLTGIDVARRIRTQLRIPVLYLTAHSDPETLRLATETAPCGFLVKPFDERSLYAAIEVCLHNAAHARQRREKDLWLKALPDNMADAVVMTDPKGLVKFANSAALELLKTTAPEVLGRRVSEVVKLLDADTGQPLLPSVTEPLSEARPSPARQSLVMATDGSQSRAEVTASPIRSPEGAVFGILYTFRALPA